MRTVLSLFVVSAVALPAWAALDPSDPSIILLHQFNDQASGNLDNNQLAPEPFVDSAPTGTAQNHEDFNDGASDGPQWVTGGAFAGIGTGSGLDFDASDNDHTRFQNWLATSQGNYANGKSFTLMLRVNTDIPDNTTLGLVSFGGSSNYLQLQGGGSGVFIQSLLREGAGGGETRFYYSSSGVGGIDNPGGGPITASGGAFQFDRNEWNNIFLIYDANSSITLAADDGTTFQHISTNDINDPSFDSLTHGFADAGINGALAALFVQADNPNTLNALIESHVVWDRALTLGEADAIDLTTIPEPATLALLGLGGLLALRRRQD